MPFPTGTELIVAQRPRVERSFRLVQPLVYKGKRDTIIVPAGFETDFATVPAIVAWLIERFGTFTAAAVVHDWLCELLRALHDGTLARFLAEHGASADTVVVSSRDADALFRRILRECDVDFVTRWLMWTGVRWGALFSGYRRAGWIKDAPLVLLISVLASPLVIPPTLLAIIARATVRVVRFFTRSRKATS